ncbi:DUF5808 domain-containing protein [Corynebacterium pseudotuberculosis]|uniref:DUF5808 domain-containing protein n=1 Tax=Corynebacterium pseudotuberculosis TaxID=1719 RepID=UPI0002E19B30|nr:DUF5808 domain-containing protein [Corynebacterium pseudotuberculosis]AFM08149.2 hypothetical protein CP162_09610 [Corynebacterium pseudotuberculosis Cp162]APG82559.1 Hypothetical protein CPI37_1941 [Corynebacterium pseudotuberculosis]WFP66976.1 hypothetical protein P8128_09530 [Corynebacterium pseudotuberculosis]
MTNFYEREQDGTIRIFGVAVHSPQTQFKIFEPENPALFIPRTWGIGWDLNVGAVAVKLGLVRPDDSLPDLQEYVPSRTLKALKYMPFIGAGIVSLAACATKHKRVSYTALSGTMALWSADKDVTAKAQTLGLQTMAFLDICAGKSGSRPLSTIAVLSLPVVTTAVVVGTVKSALLNLDATLKAKTNE